MTKRINLLLLAGAIAGCTAGDRDAAAPTLPQLAAMAAAAPTPRFLERGPHAPPFATGTVELTAVLGKGGEATLRFGDGTPFATFRVGPETLRGATLNGRHLPAGQPLRITMTPADRVRFVVSMEPSGVLFNPDSPAELHFHYRHGARRAGEHLGVLKQERPGDPWVSVASADVAAEGAVHAVVDGFTKYAISSGGRSGESGSGGVAGQ